MAEGGSNNEWEQFKAYAFKIDTIIAERNKSFKELIAPLHDLAKMFVCPEGMVNPDENPAQKMINEKLMTFEMEHFTTSALQLTTRLRLKGIHQFTKKDEHFIAESLMYMSTVNDGLSNMLLVYNDYHTKQKVQPRQVRILRKIIHEYTDIRLDIEGFMVELAYAYSEEDLIECMKGEPSETLIGPIIQEIKTRSLPQRMTLTNFYLKTAGRKIWEKVDNAFSSDAVVYAAGEKCGVCMDPFTATSEFAMLDTCEHIICFICAEKLFSKLSDRLVYFLDPAR